MVRSVVTGALTLALLASCSSAPKKTDIPEVDRSGREQAIAALAAAETPEEVSDALKALALEVSGQMVTELQDTSEMSDREFKTWIGREIELIKLQDARRELTRRDLEFLASEIPELLKRIRSHTAEVEEIERRGDDSKWAGLLPEESSSHASSGTLEIPKGQR